MAVIRLAPAAHGPLVVAELRRRTEPAVNLDIMTYGYVTDICENIAISGKSTLWCAIR